MHLSMFQNKISMQLCIWNTSCLLFLKMKQTCSSKDGEPKSIRIENGKTVFRVLSFKGKRKHNGKILTTTIIFLSSKFTLDCTRRCDLIFLIKIICELYLLEFWQNTELSILKKIFIKLEWSCQDTTGCIPAQLAQRDINLLWVVSITNNICLEILEKTFLKNLVSLSKSSVD